VVEAVPRYIEDLTGQLRELGYRVVIARSGTEALEKARQLQPRVILLNPLLPLLSGWDVLVLLKSDAKTSQIPILVTSTRGEKQRAEQNCADGFLCLPVEKADLNSSLECLGEPVSTQSKRLTILRLREPTTNYSLHALDLAFSSQSSALNYRILEAEDVEQADIIARVWHPDVILLDGEDLSNPLEYLQNLSQQPALAALPLVTLDAKTTQAANQLPNLTAFPCLVDSGQESLEALLEVIKVASGMGSQSHVLVYGNWEKTNSQQEKVNSGQSKSTGGYEWLQALVNYLQTAGLRSSLSNSWQEVYSQIQYRSLDLLLLYVDNRDDYGSLIRQLQPLAKMENKPTILVFDHRCLGDKSNFNEQEKLLNQLLDKIATNVFQAHSYSMNDLLAQIHRMVSH
jgi:CheY-like chemotaxis protein